MKNRSALVLMEQLVMILVFALVAAVCLQIFLGADSISQKTQLKDHAVMLAQNGAETAKLHKGDMTKMAQTLGGTTDGVTLETQTDDLRMVITILPEEMPGLGQAQIRVLQTQTDTELYSLTVGWQEEVP